MDGAGWMLIGLGHDTQLLDEFVHARALRTPGVFFSDDECASLNDSRKSLQRLAGTFAAKEAFYKAYPVHTMFYWTDIEITHNTHGRPTFHLRGAVEKVFQEHQWSAHLSISHSGDYASAVVLILQTRGRDVI